MNQNEQLEKFLMNGPLIISYVFATLIAVSSVNIVWGFFK